MDLYRDLFRIIMMVLLGLCSIVLVVVVAMQSNRNEGGTSAMFGGNGSDNFGSKNRNKTLDGKLALITKVSATVAFVFAIAIAVLDKVLPVVTAS